MTVSVSRFATLVCGIAIAIARQAGAARAEIKKQWIDYKDGTTPLYGLFVYDDAISGKRPGVLLAPDRAGMAQNAFRDSEMIAKLGYVVFVEDTRQGHRAKGRPRNDRADCHLQQ
jgi:hypothetical protein